MKFKPKRKILSKEKVVDNIYFVECILPFIFLYNNISTNEISTKVFEKKNLKVKLPIFIGDIGFEISSKLIKTSFKNINLITKKYDNIYKNLNKEFYNYVEENNLYSENFISLLKDVKNHTNKSNFKINYNNFRYFIFDENKNKEKIILPHAIEIIIKDKNYRKYKLRKLFDNYI